MTRKCTRCPAQIIDVTFLKKDGTTSKGVVDAEPAFGGNVLVDSSTDEARVLTGAELTKARVEGVPLHLSHFATCVQAEYFKRRKK